MPLVKEIKCADYHLLLWRVEETLEELRDNLPLRTNTLSRLEGMKSAVHQKGFIAVRQLLSLAGYSDLELYYDEQGKPSLADGKCISISHSFDYACIIVGDTNVGIDIEMKRDKIKRIAPKFCNELELECTRNTIDEIRLLTEIWCAKEAVFKMCESRSLSFREDMQVEMDKSTVAVCSIGFSKEFRYSKLDLDDFMLVFALEA